MDIEKQGPCIWIFLTRLNVCQIVVHSATAFQSGRPTFGGNLPNFNKLQLFTHLVLFDPIPERQRIRVHDQCGSLSVRGNNTRGSGKTQVGAGSHKKAKGKVVTLVEQSVVVLDEADHPLSDFGQGVGQFDADAIKAPLQTFKMLIECEKIARKRANLLCDGTPLDESPIVNGDRYFGCRDKLTVP